MSEVSENAWCLITTSYQAYKRIDVNDKDTLYFNSLVSIFFLGVYLEESVDYIIKRMKNKYQELEAFALPHKPGLLNEYVWYYNEFIAENNGEHKEDKSDIYFNNNFSATMEKLEKEFEGFTKIYEFRNYIAHGDLDKAIGRIKSEYKNKTDVDSLRTHAKDITTKLVHIAQNANYKNIDKNISCSLVIGAISRYGSSS